MTTLTDIIEITRGTGDFTEVSLPTRRVLGHINSLHLQWAHERFPDIMQKTVDVTLNDEAPTVLENFRAANGLSEILWVNTESNGALTRRETTFDHVNLPSRSFLVGEYSPIQPYYIVNGLDLEIHATGKAEIRGQVALPIITEAELDTHTNPLLATHPNLYVAGIIFMDRSTTVTAEDPTKLATAADQYQAALQGVQGSEGKQRVKLP